jgi:hypothetical protein
MPSHKLASPSAPPSSASSQPASPSPTFLHALVDLAACDDLDDLLDATEAILDRELRLHGAIELWAVDDSRFACGHVDAPVHTIWIGIRYTVGAIHIAAPTPGAIHVAAPTPAAASSNSAALTAAALPATTRDALQLLAQQLAPLAERLLDREASKRRSIRDDIKLLYERRIRDALIRRDWNISAVARELRVGRTRVGQVAHHWRSRSEQLFCARASTAIANNNSDHEVQPKNDYVLNRSGLPSNHPLPIVRARARRP